MCVLELGVSITRFPTDDGSKYIFCGKVKTQIHYCLHKKNPKTDINPVIPEPSSLDEFEAKKAPIKLHLLQEIKAEVSTMSFFITRPMLGIFKLKTPHRNGATVEKPAWAAGNRARECPGARTVCRGRKPCSY